jgi:hypothetical protein
MTTLLCKNIIVEKSKEVKTGSHLAKSSKEDYSSKKGSFGNEDDFGYTEQGLPK